MSRKLLNEELNRLTTEEYKDAEKLPIVVVLDNVRSLNNIGSVFRTSDAFRLSKIYLCGITATPPHREIHKITPTDIVPSEKECKTDFAVKNGCVNSIGSRVLKKQCPVTVILFQKRGVNL